VHALRAAFGVVRAASIAAQTAALIHMIRSTQQRSAPEKAIAIAETILRGHGAIARALTMGGAR
jgi:hypothetical protein